MLYSYPLLEQEARAVLGLQVPLVVLSSRAIFSTVLPSVGFDWQSPGRSSKRVLGMLVVTGMIVFTFPSTFCNIFERVSRLRDHPEAFSLTRDEYDALRFLRDAPGEEVVLSADWIGNYVPRLTHKHSWLGLLDVPSRDSRLSSAKRFFSEDTSPSARYDFLNQNDIGFIYYGQEERTLGGFDPKGALFLKSVFRNDSVEIYRVESQGATGEEMRSL
jgi:hypothetical protein